MAFGGSSQADLQFLLSGAMFVLALEQLWAATWARQRRLPLWTGVTAAALGLVIGLNALILQHHANPDVEYLLFVRFAAASVLPASTVFLAAALGDRKAPRSIVGFCLAGALLRLCLWPTTHLISAHHLQDGWPAYGPLPPVLTIPFILLAFGYLTVCLIQTGSSVERYALLLGGAGATSLAVADFTVTSGPAISEQLSGWAIVPLFLALLVIVGRRQAMAARAQESQIARESSLAKLARHGLTTTAAELVTEAEQLASQHPSEPSFVEAARGITHAVAQRDAVEHAMLYRATHDELTGLLNRSELRAALSETLEGPPLHVAVLQVGVDAMRSINDSFGHPVGDGILQAISTRLHSALPQAWLLSRIDGDEFVAVIVGEPRPTAETAKHVLCALHVPYELTGFSGSITVAMGVAVRPAGTRRNDADGLLHDADIAMHRAKASGGRDIAYFDDWMRAELLRVRGLEHRMSRAVERDELALHYEPIVALDDRRPIAYEALARWTCEGEMIPPASWIPVAEQTGHLIDIGRHLATLATDQLRGWRGAGSPVDVSLNVSARQLRTPDLARTLDAAVERGLNPEQLWLEVTEGIAVDDTALAALKGLRDRGFRIVLDDFGTGYSSLHAIGRLPIDIVKIDRSFVANLGNRPAYALVAAVVSIADANGLDIVAEGIETEAQARRLIELGCRWGQGYLFGRAAPPETFLPANRHPSGLPPRSLNDMAESHRGSIGEPPSRAEAKQASVTAAVARVSVSGSNQPGWPRTTAENSSNISR